MSIPRKKMLMVQCYIDDCDFNTPDVEDATGATVLDHHLARELRYTVSFSTVVIQY